MVEAKSKHSGPCGLRLWKKLSEPSREPIARISLRDWTGMEKPTGSRSEPRLRFHAQLLQMKRQDWIGKTQQSPKELQIVPRPGHARAREHAKIVRLSLRSVPALCFAIATVERPKKAVEDSLRCQKSCCLLKKGCQTYTDSRRRMAEHLGTEDGGNRLAQYPKA